MKTGRMLFAACSTLLVLSPSWSRDRYDDLVKNIPYEDIQELRVKIEIGVAELLIEKAQGDNLLEAKIHYKIKRGEPRIRYDRSGRVGYLTIKSPDADDEDEENGRSIRGLNSGDETWELRFSPKVESSFEIEVGLVDGEINMSGLKVSELSICSGLSDLELAFDVPNPVRMKELVIECGLGDFTAFNLGNANFERARLESGLGSIKADLAGSWNIPEVEMTVEVGLGSARLEIPESLGLEVNADENFLSSLDLDLAMREVRSGRHRSDNWDAAACRLIIDADVGLGSLKVETK
ncbi:MAG TPA: toast rack family protein [bacterium]|jgi:hypothetical protein